MDPLKPRRATGALLALLAAGTVTASARADAVSNFYSSKDITIQVGFGADGGYDTTTRLFARYFGKHVPGNPSIVVQNVPGAGSMKVANALFTVTPKDGTVLGVFGSS